MSKLSRKFNLAFVVIHLIKFHAKETAIVFFAFTGNSLGALEGSIQLFEGF